MSDMIRILQEADGAAVEVEQSRQKFEAAKAALEKAKAGLEESQEYLNQVYARGEESGISKSKLRKLIEERTSALMSSGLLGDFTPAAPKAPKAPRKKAPAPAETVPDETSHLELVELQ